MTTIPRQPTGGDVLVAVMKRHGIDTAFGVISVHNLPLVEAVSRELRFVEMRHEAAVVNAADGYSRATGRIGVALTSTGTGAGNAAGSMVEALTAGSRVLHITGQIDSEHYDASAPGPSRGVIHEFPGQLQMLEAISVFAATVPSADRAEAVLEEALAAITGIPGGPASVEWPSDLQYLARPDEQQPHAVEPGSAPRPDGDALDAAAALLATAERPLLWVGGGAAGARAELTALAHRLGAGVLTSNSGRAIIPEDDDLVVGNFASTPAVAPLLAEADLMLSIGTHFRSNETKSYHLELPKRHVQIDVDPAAVGRVYPAEIGLVGDASAVLAALLERLPETTTDAGWPQRVRAVREGVRADLYGYIGGYADICRGLRTVLPREAVVARDVTIPSSQWGNRLLEFYDRSSNIFPLGGGIGQGLAMGIGAAVGRPEVPTVVIAGDGGLAVHLGELASLCGTGAWVVVLVFNDGGYGVLRNMQQANGLDVTGVDLFTPDFGLLARSMDMPYWLVRDASTFEPVLREAVAARRPVFIEVDVTALEPKPGAFTPPVHIPTPTGRA
ncbi:thiamine pyrophosphate-binding protein [Geodermatophilus sabuli]|uniref:Acetolactate synthase-1/2/3 large subunit n=1 Tax=Geodermatophilus sabuli TaxID=1564158 RepID=A0A285EAB5_9ACTN|nr:thiamine pyrophosphate-binding protein [Geodermatophilus sabuli]MBB3085498.1 acetolactate synthase-1/2/3 large subunit [Geodermatophilus sabuli]SNX96078.1 acetolactate synthase-1/2/3 large subunit [Geodermatophilus sabuli]